MLKFARGEGIWFDAGLVYLATTTDETIHVYDTNAATVSILYRAAEAPGTPLRGVDNVHVSRSGDVFVGEDSYTGDPDAMDICIITPERHVARFCKVTGPGHFVPAQSETVGIAFDPSGTRMYLGSQRYLGAGIVYEISGPFRQAHPAIAAPPVDPCPPGPPAPGPPAPRRARRPPWPASAPATGAPGLPIGIEVSRRISVDALIRKGLAIALTLDAAATVKVRMTARVTSNGRRRTITLVSATRKPATRHHDAAHQAHEGAGQGAARPPRAGSRRPSRCGSPRRARPSACSSAPSTVRRLEDRREPHEQRHGREHQRDREHRSEGEAQRTKRGGGGSS